MSGPTRNQFFSERTNQKLERLEMEWNGSDLSFLRSNQLCQCQEEVV